MNSRFEIDKEPEPAFGGTQNDQKKLKARYQQREKHSELNLVVRHGRWASSVLLGSDKEDEDEEENKYERNIDSTVFYEQSKEGGSSIEMTDKRCSASVSFIPSFASDAEKSILSPNINMSHLLSKS